MHNQITPTSSMAAMPCSAPPSAPPPGDYPPGGLPPGVPLSGDTRPRVSQIVRRGAAIAALCVAVATGTATWLSDTRADAAPGKGAGERVVRAPAKGEKPGKNAGADDQAEADGSAQDDMDEPGQEGGRAPAVKKNGKTLTGKLNINTATEEEFVLLPGIGPAKAQRIIAHRSKRKFQRVKDLRQVKGIGYKTLKKLAPFLTVTGESTLQLE